MAEIKRVKIQNFIETQIPEFLNVDNPLFKEFLSQYYTSLEHQSGAIDVAINLNSYKNIENFNSEVFFSNNTPHVLTAEVEPFHTTINLNHTIGFPDSYGLLKIDNEIITYKTKTDTKLEGCIRGFSGIELSTDNGGFKFSATDSEFHLNNSRVENLSFNFFVELFKKFKYQFIPGFENRNFNSQVNLQTILSRAKDFYTTKGTDTSYKILFKILYNEKIELIKPQEYMLRPSDNTYFLTKNILVERVLGLIDPKILKGYTLYQQTKDGIASATIYNVEIRPIEDGRFLYEISLDPSSFILEFVSTKTSKVIESVNSNNSVITVDSTVGVSTNRLLVNSKNSPSPFFINYSEKTINQFLGVENLEVGLSESDIIIEDNFAYVDVEGELVYFRLLNVIDNLDFSKTFGMVVEDKIGLSSFGLDLGEDSYFNKWIYNIPTTHKIKSINPTSQPNRKLIETYDTVRFIKGESILLSNSFDVNSTYKSGNIVVVNSNNTIEVESVEDLTKVDTIKKLVTKSNVLNYPEINNLVSNIQNTYLDSENENLYVASSGLPDYQIVADDRKILLSTPSNPNPNSGIAYTTILNTNKFHRFYTGERVWVDSEYSLGISTGSYYITTIGNYNDSNKISLSYSNSDLFNKKYINVSYGSTGNLVKSDYQYKTLEHQKLLKKIKLSNDDRIFDDTVDKSTNNKQIGMLLNGVEIYSPTLYDENIYYGKLDKVEITNPGTNYDIVNTPELFVDDSVNGIQYGSGAKLHLCLSGKVSRIDIVNPGSGYDKNLKVSLIGGNGSGVLLEPIIIKDRINSGFRGDGVGINPTNNSIRFISPHNFEDGEIVEYFSNSNVEIEYSDPIIQLVDGVETIIGGQIRKLSENSFYYVGLVSDTEIKLYRKKDDAANKINEINLTTSPSSGFHYFRSVLAKNTLVGVSVKESGSGYSNRKVVIPAIENDYSNQNGINVIDNYIFAKDHNFKDKDLVVYTTNGASISGLSTESKYYVKTINKDIFRLSLAGVGNTITDVNYFSEKYVRLSSTGSGTHTFKYPPIELKVEASQESSNGKLILPILEPVVLGSAENVFVEDGGKKYGTNDIINFHRRPRILVGNIQSQAVLKPLISNGAIIDIQILNSGSGYGNGVDLIINGNGNFADIYPVIENGKLVSTKIINGGVGYSTNTTLELRPRGSDVKFIPDIFQWKINQVEKNKFLLQNIDEGLLVPSRNQQDGLQFIHFYPPKVFRDKLDDNLNNNGTEISSPIKTSPILGWSYDGFPIYGPYSIVDNSIQITKSSYIKSIELDSDLRPTGNMFPGGFFIQDYIYNPFIGDLDQYNGKFIKNQDFPDGTYAYFYTIELDVNNKSIPKYPYLVSDEFKSHYRLENYEPSYNQNLNFEDLGLIRNTAPYFLNSKNSNYNFIDSVDSKYNQTFVVKSVSSSGIDSISIYNPGEYYEVGDVLDFGGVEEGSGAYASVSEILGKEIESFTVGVTTRYPVTFSKLGNKIVGYSKTALNVSNNDILIISKISNPSYKFLEGPKNITVLNKNVGLSSDILDIGTTGNITKIYPNDIIGFEVDDYIKIDNEEFRILQVIPESSSLTVERLSNPGVHTSGISNVISTPRKFTFFDSSSKLISKINVTDYFNPEVNVATGSSEKEFTRDDGSKIYIPQKSIYIPNHSYNTGQPLTYNVGIGGTGLYVYDDTSPIFQLEDNQTVYAVNLGIDFVGISTVGFTSNVGIGSSNYSLYFSSPVIGIGIAHSLTTKYSEVSGKVENYFVNINTKTNHELENNDVIKLNISPNIQKSIKFRYDSSIRKITTELIDFDSSIIDVNTSEIQINDLDLKTGDKIVYYNEGNTSIGGLEDNKTYFVINSNPGRIKLSNYYSDSINGEHISLASTSIGNHSIAKINPKIEVTGGNYITFDLSDPSLTNIRLKLFKDKNFKREFENYLYISSNGERYINSSLNNYPRELYYFFEYLNQNIYPDNEVKDYNFIEIKNSSYNINYKVSVIDKTNFKLNLGGMPESIDYSKNNLTNLYYTTNSKNVNGSIAKIKINSNGVGYKTLPKVQKIISTLGKDAIIQTKSKNIGKISSLERVKDGFDYPTDVSLVPKLSVPALVQVEGISRVDKVGVVTGGVNYNSKPTLKIIGNNDIILDPVLDGTSIVDVDIISNVSNLTTPLRIVPTRNSNGYSIDDIVVSGTDVTLELLNSDNQIYPLITTGYGSTEVIFPFSIGDEIFIERCRISLDEIDGNGNIVQKDNYNSSNYDYRFFTVTGISTINYTLTYSMDGISNNLGNYTPDFGYGYVINRKDMAEFEMIIANDLKYLSDEVVLGYDSNNNNTFSAVVMKNGWNNDTNELRLIDVKGKLEIGNILKGQNSLLSGTVTDLNVFNLTSTVSVTRDKINDLGDRIGFLNDFQQRISDNDYYQKFSYSIKGKVPYNIWKEPIRSIIHPSGFKEFSDLTIVGGSTAKMKVGTASSLELTVNIDSFKSVYSKNNFAMVTEEDQFEDGSIERVVFEEGVALKPYILSRSNKVTLIDDISPQFDGTSNLQIIANKDVTFISTDLYRLGVTTDGLSEGDKIGYSTYHFYPDSTYILNIGENYIELSKDTPHRLYSNNGVSTSIIQNLDFYRRIPGDVITGISSFKLTNNNYPLFYREFDASNGISTVVNLVDDSFIIPNHNLYSGQRILYTPEYLNYSAIASTTIGSGAILEPIIVGTGSSIFKINVIDGGSGYDPINTPNIQIIGTKSPLENAEFNVLIEPISGIITSIIVTNSGYGYFPISTGEIGIVTTTESEGRKDILMGVGGGIGSAIYENGYNVAISTTISGISSAIIPNFSGFQNRFWGFGEPYIPVKSTSGSGIDAKFSVFIVYNSTTGNPISTSLILRDGGRGYSVGESISIAGTFMGGSTPANDLSFIISKVSSTRIPGEANSVYSNILADSTVGYGTGAILEISRDSFGDIFNVNVISGGINYELTDNISIAGTFIGGSTPGDNLFISPTILGTDKLPRTLYVDRINDTKFKVAGISTGSILNITSTGIGTHSFSIENPNPNSLITIDNIIQTPIYNKNLETVLSKNILYTDNIIYISSGISSVVLNDILKIGDEYMSIKNIGVNGSDSILVERAILGTKKSVYNSGDPVYVLSGNYNIVNDVIYFTSPPYGPKGVNGLEINSSFSGRTFSRRYDPFTFNNESIIFDDISDQFTGIAATEFVLKSNGSNVVGIFTDTNSIIGGQSGTDIDNTPLILINNIPQIGGLDYVIDTPGQNTIRFISGVPLAGKITDIGVTTGFGYLPLVGASATVSVSAAGTISNITLTGFGKGYRNPPLVSIASTVGYGASIISTIGTSGTVTSLQIVNPGSGYTNTIVPEVRIDIPQNYYNIPLEYASGYSGIGTGAKISIVVGNGSSIVSYNLDQPGTAYEVGDVLVAPGITTDLNSPSFEEFRVTVLETFTDSFSGWYPGQFIQFDDFSQFFNGTKRRFTLTVTINGNKQVLSLKALEGLTLTDNLFVFINDVLQVPGESYTFTGTRIIFSEPPKAGSKCNILFYKGSDLDVEQVEPILTIKEGDLIQIDENRNDPFDRPQFERTVKDIVATDILDTFTYDSLGISIDPNKIRPLNWTKQTKDKVINGVLYSKSRPSYKSKVIPESRVIKNIDKTDIKIYTDTAIPTFSNLDENRGVPEGLRNIIVLNNRTIESPIVNSIVSTSSTISNINILSSGTGYENINTPLVSISSRFITRKDPIYQWSPNLGISTTYNLSSIDKGNNYISVGNSGLNLFSYDGDSWYVGIETFSSYNLNDVIGYQNNYIVVGDNANIYRTTGLSTNSSWELINLLDPTTDILGNVTTEPSDYSGNFKKVEYNNEKNILVAVGSSGGLFSAVGLDTSAFYENLILPFDFNSVVSNDDLFVVVGQIGSILYSQDSVLWNTITKKATLQNLNDIIWDGDKFISVGNNGTIITSTNAITWDLVPINNFSSNILKINYHNNLYTILDSDGKLYFSLNLEDWDLRDNIGNQILDIISVGDGDDERYISIGTSGFISRSTPVINEAVAISSSNNGVLSQITILNGGFGYSLQDKIPVIVETDTAEVEQIFSIKSKGDYGTITDIEVFETGNVVAFGTTSPAISFTLKSDNFPTLLPTIEYTPLEIGDYFVITDSNVLCGHALTGITTSLGGASGYPNSKVGTAISYIDGIYRAEYVTEPSLGICTVRCFFMPIPAVGADKIEINVGINTFGFYGRYSFGLIYDYQNRAREVPKNFIINSDEGLVGLETGPMIYRTRGII